MRPTLVGLTLSLLVLGGGAGARAQEGAFPDRRGVLLSAERMFGFVHTEQTLTVDGVSQSDSQDSFTLFANPISTLAGHSFPRVGLDFLISPRVTLGGAAGFFHAEQGSDSVNGLLLAPRVGYLAILGPKLQVWPRGGFTFQHRSGDSAGISVSSTFYALTVEAPLVILIPPRVGILFGPSFDFGLGGSTSLGGMEAGNKITELAFQTGVLIVF